MYQLATNWVFFLIVFLSCEKGCRGTTWCPLSYVPDILHKQVRLAECATVFQIMGLVGKEKQSITVHSVMIEQLMYMSLWCVTLRVSDVS